MLRTSWAYSLKREELVKYLGQYQHDYTGNVEDMRKRFAKCLATEHHEDEMKELLTLEGKHEATLKLPFIADSSHSRQTSPAKAEEENTCTTKPNEENTQPNVRMNIPTPSTSIPDNNDIGAIEVVRQWGLNSLGERKCRNV